MNDNENLTEHRQNVRAYLRSCLLSYGYWSQRSPRKRNYLLKSFCAEIQSINSNFEIYLEEFKKKHQDYLTIKTPAKRERHQRPSEPVKGFTWICGHALANTLPLLLAAQSKFKSEAEVAYALIHHPEFKEFLADYANDFYLDLLDDGLI